MFGFQGLTVWDLLHVLTAMPVCSRLDIQRELGFCAEHLKMHGEKPDVARCEVERCKKLACCNGEDANKHKSRILYNPKEPTKRLYNP